MKLELKDIDRSEALSRETPAFTATLPLVDFDGILFPETAETTIFDLVYTAQDDVIDPAGDSFRMEVVL